MKGSNLEDDWVRHGSQGTRVPLHHPSRVGRSEGRVGSDVDVVEGTVVDELRIPVVRVSLDLCKGERSGRRASVCGWGKEEIESPSGSSLG